MAIKLIPAYEHTQEVRELFTEYTAMLSAQDSAFKEYLAIQNYGEELEHLADKYGFPSGRLYLAYDNDELAGCIGLRKIDEQSCEMKRLYVRAKFQGNHIGTLLVQQLIKDAREIGYTCMLLDTLPFLKNAIRLYKMHGFYEVESYNNSPMDTSIYMKLDL